VGDLLIVPSKLTRLGMHRDNRIRIEIVAFAEGKLLNAGVQKASVENKTVKTIKIVKNFFIA